MGDSKPLTVADETRLRTLLEATPRTWVALDETRTRCVGQAPSLKEAVEQARQNGCSDPIMLFVPEDWRPAILLLCA